MKLLVAGYGSIGARHARLAAQLGHRVEVVSRNSDCPFPLHASIAGAVRDGRPDRVLVANETALHAQVLESLHQAGYDGPLLIEKPVFMAARQLPAHLAQYRAPVFVAYNMRFHPMIAALRDWLQGQALVSAAFEVGQYLPDWRPGTDYRKSYSADPALGGGVLRDLSHEIDLAIWLAGEFTQLSALGGQLSALEIRSDDAYAILGRTARCRLVTVALNYLNRPARRCITINTNQGTAQLDFIRGELNLNGQVQQIESGRDLTYTHQLEAFFALDARVLCPLRDGLSGLHAVEAIERASGTLSWQSPTLTA